MTFEARVTPVGCARRGDPGSGDGSWPCQETRRIESAEVLDCVGIRRETDWRRGCSTFSHPDSHPETPVSTAGAALS